MLLASKILIAGAFLAFAAYIWVEAPTFGSQPQCNESTVYVVFGVSIRATEPVFRWVVLGLMIAMVVTAAFFMTCFGAIAACMCGVRRKERIVRSNDVALAGNILARLQYQKGKGRAAGLQAEIIAVAMRSAVNLYAIITLEQTIGRNRVGTEEREWSFGQVLAIFMLVGVAVEVLSIFLAEIDEKDKQGDLDAEQMVGGQKKSEMQQQQQVMISDSSDAMTGAR